MTMAASSSDDIRASGSHTGRQWKDIDLGDPACSTRSTKGLQIMSKQLKLLKGRNATRQAVAAGHTLHP